MLGNMRYYATFYIYSYSSDDLGVSTKSNPVEQSAWLGKNERFNPQLLNSGSPQGSLSIEVYGYKNDLTSVKQNDEFVIDSDRFRVESKRFEFPDKIYLVASKTDAGNY